MQSASVKSDTESIQSSSKSSMGSESSKSQSEEDISEAGSQVGICCSPPRSISEAEIQRMRHGSDSGSRSRNKPMQHKLTTLPVERPRPRVVVREGPPMVKLRAAQGVFD